MSINEVHIQNGREFPYPFRFYLVIAIAVIGTVITGQFLALAFALIGLYGLTARRGTVVRSGSYKRYFSVFGVRFGSFEALPSDAALVLLNVNYTVRGGTHGGQVSMQNEGIWELFLVNAKHRGKISFGKSENKSELEDKAAAIQGLTGVRLEHYNPAISPNTRRRKRR